MSEHVEVLIAYAEGRIQHLNRGSCPDSIEGHDSRDPECPVCAALTRSEVPAGWVLVPREPTEAMMSAWFNGICNDGRTLAIDDDIRAAARQDWSVMIEAAS